LGDIAIWRFQIDFGLCIGLQDRENDKVSLAVDSGLWWATNVQGAGPHGLESINPVELNFLGPGRLRQHHGRRESSAAVTILTGIL
jgi:hypothetical protein